MNQTQLPFLPNELWFRIYDFKEAMELEENTRKLKPVTNSIKELNKMVLDIDSMCWGEYTEEQADDRFNKEFDDDGELNEWGTKSASILYWVDMVGGGEHGF
tara:strand:+ start:836 stop:1141 length:306 start_codon:yes stop_codon:yes gene_type:complete